jgi:hypothetical protein
MSTAIFPRWPHINEPTVRAIANAVEGQGGDMDDVENLCDAWERLAADRYGRQDRLHAENRKRQEEARAEERRA